MRPGRIKTENGALNGVKCVKMALCWLKDCIGLHENEVGMVH